VGYSVSYPFGGAGPILFLHVAFMILKPKIGAAQSRADTLPRAGRHVLRAEVRRDRPADRSADAGACGNPAVFAHTP